VKPSVSVAGLALLAWPAIAVSQGPRTIRYASVPAGAIVSLTKPSFTIPSGDCEFNAISGVVMQKNGGIVVPNNMEELCYYDGRGAFRKKTGRKGAGPGEFAFLEQAALYRGDSIVTTDRFQRRISIFGPAGEPGRQFPIQAPESLASPGNVLALMNGEFLLSFMEFHTTAPQREAMVFYQQLVRASATGAAGARVLRIVQGEHFVQALRPEDNMGSTAYWDLEWGRKTSWSVTPAGFIAGDGGDNVVREYDASGQVRVLHVVPLSRARVTSELIAEYKKAELASAKPARRAMTERLVNEMPYPAEKPAYNNMIADHAGPIWVQSYPDTTGSYWLRLDPAKATTTAFRFPPKFRLYAVRDDKACGVGRDDDDLQTVYCFDVRP
jgi:hypothetical protein